MAKSTTTYWNSLSSQAKERWVSIQGLEDMAEEIILSIDEESGEYTKLTRFFQGQIQHLSVGRRISTLKRYSLLAAGCMTKRLKCG